MKRLILLYALLLLQALSLNANSLTRKEMEHLLKGRWELDNNGNVTISKVINVKNMSKDEIFNSVLSYFTYNYNNGESVVQIQDKEAGLIVGKGVYPNVHVGKSLATTKISTTHIVRVDVKEGKVRVMVSLQQYRRVVITSYTGATPNSYNVVYVRDCYPVTDKDLQKTVMLKAFFKSYNAAKQTISNIEKGLVKGHTGYEIDTDW